jgi:hypothetical protein
MYNIHYLLSFWLCLSLVFAGSRALAEDIAGNVEFTVVDRATGEPVPCRIHLSDRSGQPQRPRSAALPFWRDHFACPGTARLDVAPGEYTYEVERGPEYARASGRFTLKAGDQGPSKSPVSVHVVLERLADLAREGWWSGELHVHRPISEVALLMQAEDLHIAPVITWWHNRKMYRNLWEGAGEEPGAKDKAKGERLPDDPLIRFDGNRYYHVLAGEDERGGGALLYFNLRRPLDLSGASLEDPSPMTYVAEARRQGGRALWIDIEKPFWWDVPVWLASGQVDSIGLANNHMWRSGMYADEAWGRPRDANRLPPPRGNGFWTQEIYYQVLNCGLRIPPSAGSASGVLNNAVGYNRVYVHLDGPLSYPAWWDALRAGNVFVTNGPLLRVRANRQFPGHVFTSEDGSALDINLDALLTTRDPIRTIEIIRDGRVERSIPHDAWARSGTSTLGRLHFEQSGWFLVRTIAEVPETFRFASTGPFYVEIGPEKRRISKTSARFFVDWVRTRAGQIALEDPARRREVLRHHQAAEVYWTDLLSKANAE